MDALGLICFIWAIAFCIASIIFKVTTWSDWDITRPVTDKTWSDTPKGLLLAPPVFALIWPTADAKFSFDPIPMFFWERLALLLIGLCVGILISRQIKQQIAK